MWARRIFRIADWEFCITPKDVIIADTDFRIAETECLIADMEVRTADEQFVFATPRRIIRREIES